MKRSKPLSGRTVLFWLFAFFGTVAAVDGAFIVVAERSFPGFSTPNAYETGLEYNRVLAAAEAQRALGWQVELTADGSRALTLRVRDRNGVAVDSSRVTAQIGRPADARDDHSLVLTMAAPGVYRAEGALPAPGTWDVQVRVRRPDGADYRIEQRLVAP